MNLSNLIKSVFIIFVLLSSCKPNKSKTTETSNTIVLEKLTDSPPYSVASLELEALDSTNVKEAGLNFNFKVENYTLGVQTESPNTSRLANSGKGQHIHFILNNQPYSAHYEPRFSKDIPEGVHHMVAFLSRSYHESVKNKNSVIIKKLIIGSTANDTIELNMEAPTLIYSRPKGNYQGKETEHLLLDFFILNTKLSKDGNKVKATINQEEFLITEWAPHIIKGLPKGKVTIALELIDPEGMVIPGPFNKVNRVVTLLE